MSYCSGLIIWVSEIALSVLCVLEPIPQHHFNACNSSLPFVFRVLAQQIIFLDIVPAPGAQRLEGVHRALGHCNSQNYEDSVSFLLEESNFFPLFWLFVTIFHNLFVSFCKNSASFPSMAGTLFATIFSGSALYSFLC